MGLQERQRGRAQVNGRQRRPPPSPKHRRPVFRVDHDSFYNTQQAVRKSYHHNLNLYRMNDSPPDRRRYHQHNNGSHFQIQIHQHHHPSVVESSLLSGVHGRQRRRQRRIPKVTLQLARRYGICEPARNGCYKYTYGRHVFIYHPKRRREVTSYPVSSRWGRRRQRNGRNVHNHNPTDEVVSGTRHTQPLMLEKKYEFTQRHHLQEHQRLIKLVRQPQHHWRSHTVIVVDMSASMRTDDVNGAKCRSDAVFCSLAKDFCANQIENRLVLPTEDVVSVILFQHEGAKVIGLTEPLDWVWYNQCLEWREWRVFRPCGHGNFGPALKTAHELLRQKTPDALHCLFLSDGVPSDRGDFGAQMGRIAADFGDKLTLSCIGLGFPGAKYPTLQAMVDAATAAGAEATLDHPKLTLQSMSNSIRSFTSLSSSRTTMLSSLKGASKPLRTDLMFEPANAADDLSVNENWTIYEDHSLSSNGKTAASRYIRRIWTWDQKRDDCVYLMDPRCVLCYTNVGVRTNNTNKGGGNGGSPLVAGSNGRVCPHCKACFLCHSCTSKQHDVDCPTFQNDRRTGNLVNASVPVENFGGALKNRVFARGAERIVHKFRFFKGPEVFDNRLWVAKQSRFIEETGTHQARMDYHKKFLRAQRLAQSYAEQFNRVLNDLQDDGPFAWIGRLPRIRFLSPLIVELYGHNSDHNINILVEPMLVGKYTKFNNNMGYVGRRSMVGPGLDVIPEDNDEGRGQATSTNFRNPGQAPYNNLRDLDFPQAFSHFSYSQSRGMFMVVDLQGVLHVRSDGTREFQLTDPALHHRNKKNAPPFRTIGNLGRTDRGEKGMRAFLNSRVCTDACRLLGLRKINKRDKAAASAMEL